MYLKRIEIQGFKSFADKTEIEFKDDITAIVGPNGSGKSNISDAIRWVLGEQSIKNLRGNKMEDVIFSGTDKRRALGYAEVSIIFDNSDKLIPLDYSEIMVTRRVFRSGESEYYINKNSCRLKDIRELFMDTGIGKDGYSIIGQGRIEEILSNRPEDRRNIFEEAAEIVKYKSRKQIAEKKLDKTQTNLIRIKDLIHEIKNQAEVLEEESRRAINFTSLYNKLRDLEVNLYIKEIRKFNLQIEEINTNILNITKEIFIIETEKNSLESNYNLIKTSIENLDLEIEESRNEKYNITQSLDNSKNSISIHLEKENFYRRDLERLNSEKVDLLDKLIFFQMKIEELVDEKVLAQEKRDYFIQKHGEKTQEISELDKTGTIKQKALDEIKSKQLDIYNKASDTKNKLDNMDSYNENIIKRLEEVKLENKDLKSQIIRIKVQEENILIEKNELEAIIHKLMDQYEVLKGKREEISTKNETLLKSVKDLELKFGTLKSNQKLYINMEEGYEGYFKSVKNLLKAIKGSKDMDKGFHGIVADLIKVDKKFEKAIDISLGSNIQNLIMETDEDAKNLINYLKVKKLGRVTFLPLNTIKPSILTLKKEDIEKYNILGLGYELINYDPVYENIFKYLLGRTIIIKDIDSAISYGDRYGHINRIVTLDGDVLNPGGSMTGGSYSNNNISIINRKNKIKELHIEINEIQNNINSLKNKNLSFIEEIQDYDKLMEDNRLEKQETEMRIIGLDSSEKSLNLEISRLESEFEKTSNLIISLEKEISDLRDNKEILKKQFILLEQEISDIKVKLEGLSDELIIYNSLRDRTNNEVTEFKIKINQMENGLKNLDEKMETIRADIDLTHNFVQEKDNSIKLNQRELDQINYENKTVVEKIEELQSEEKIATEKLNLLLEKKSINMKMFYGEQDKFKEVTNKLSLMEKEKNKQEVKLAKLELIVENNQTKLLEDYELTFSEAEVLEKHISNIQKANEEVKDLRIQIKKLGSVNIGAIEDYNKTKERLDFITNQQEDLIFSRDNLREIIKDIEKNMKVQFMESFNEINHNFNEIFSVLFDGGTAKLVLEDEEDILETGIEIVVQPPGKKLQTLSLLSGGEKSLTAVALLFAILKTKPSPFCILDEIDAALDEANISRYTNYLKHFNEDTQFILITHRKTTMEIANVLYGVTMAEEGISKLISVKLKDNLNEEAS